jgi:olfactory receptor
MENRTEAKEFILLGLTSNPDLQVPLFITFLLIYIITLVGNLGMILLILTDSRLHTPMYYFLGNLSLVDFCYSSAVTPKVMAGLLIGDNIMSCNACATQMFCFFAFALWKITSWRQWPMTAMQQCVSLCIMPQS